MRPMSDSTESAEGPEVQADAGGEPATPLEGERLDLAVEAALMTSDRPMPAARLSEAMGQPGTRAIREAIERLNAIYEQTERSFRIEPVASGFQVMTRPDFADVLDAMNRRRQAQRLSPAAMETLAIIAYRQPITRADIEAIRGVGSGQMVKTLMEAHLVKITGRAEELGRPMLYGTTPRFLELFGLSGLKDLPRADELAASRIPVTGGAGEATPNAPEETTEHA